MQLVRFNAWSMSNHEPENGAEKCDHCARGECDPSLFLYSGLGYAHYRWHGGISCCFLNPQPNCFISGSFCSQELHIL